MNNIHDSEIVLYGESLGTAIAVDLAKEFSFSGIILESPFTSMAKLAKKHYPYLPVKFLLKDRYETIKKLNEINSPILVMHGAKAPSVPFDMGVKVYENANNPKFKYFTDMDDHMMNYDDKLVNEIKLFINSLN